MRLSANFSTVAVVTCSTVFASFFLGERVAERIYLKDGSKSLSDHVDDGNARSTLGIVTPRRTKGK